MFLFPLQIEKLPKLVTAQTMDDHFCQSHVECEVNWGYSVWNPMAAGLWGIWDLYIYKNTVHMSFSLLAHEFTFIYLVGMAYMIFRFHWISRILAWYPILWQPDLKDWNIQTFSPQLIWKGIAQNNTSERSGLLCCWNLPLRMFTLLSALVGWSVQNIVVK